MASYEGTKHTLPETLESLNSQTRKLHKIDVDERDMKTYNKWDEAIQTCETEFLALPHADDIYLPDFIEKTVGYLESHPECAAVFTMDYIINEKGDRIGHTPLPIPERDKYEYKEILEATVKYGNMLRCETFVCRPKMIRDAGIKYTGYCDNASDTVFWFDILDKFPIGILPEKLVKYRSHPNSDTQKNIIGSMRLWNGLAALEYAAKKRPELVTFPTVLSLARAKKLKEKDAEDLRLQERAQKAKEVELYVAHNPPCDQGTEILVADRVRRRNRDDSGVLGYYVCPAERTLPNPTVVAGVPTIYCQPEQFGEAVGRIGPTKIEYHHLLRWPLDILGVQGNGGTMVKHLYLHDSFFWCPRIHLIDKDNTLCSGPGPDKCLECNATDIQPMREELKALLPHIDRIYANSVYTHSLAKRYLPTNNEIEIYEFPIPFLEKYGRKKRIGYFGYFHQTKGVDLLLMACLKIDAQLLLFCDVPDDFREGRRIHGFPNALVMGAYSRNDMPNLCNLLDVAVVPSLTESFGLTGRELEMLGVPCIKTRVGGQTGDVEGGNVEALAEAIQEVLDGLR